MNRLRHSESRAKEVGEGVCMGEVKLAAFTRTPSIFSWQSKWELKYCTFLNYVKELKAKFPLRCRYVFLPLDWMREKN